MRRVLLAGLGLLLAGWRVTLAQPPLDEARATPVTGSCCTPGGFGEVACKEKGFIFSSSEEFFSNTCIPCPPPPDCFWASIEALGWWVKDGPLPVVLVTTGNAADAIPGALGQPGTIVQYGGSGIDYDAQSGVRLTTGFWVNEPHTIGFEGAAFTLARTDEGFNAASAINGAPVLARPFTNALTGLPDAVLISFPGALSGAIDVSSHTQLYGAELRVIGRCWNNGVLSLDWLAGVQYLGLEEDLAALQASTLQTGTMTFAGFPVAAPAYYSSSDRFDSTNDFYGGQVGARAEYRQGAVFVRLAGKLALGSTHQVLKVRGDSLLLQSNADLESALGGVLALSSNIARSTRDQFSVVPQLSIDLGFEFATYFRAFAGYSFLYWNDVVRPGDQVDGVINPALLPTNAAYGSGAGPATPSRLFRTADFWAQGVSVGLEIRY